MTDSVKAILEGQEPRDVILEARWKVGDKVLPWKLPKGWKMTTITNIKGEIVTLANGDKMHISNVRDKELKF